MLDESMPLIEKKSSLARIKDKKEPAENALLKKKVTMRKQSMHDRLVHIPLEEIGGVEHNAKWNKVMEKRRLIAMERQILRNSQGSDWVDNSIATVGLISPGILKKFSLDSTKISPKFRAQSTDDHHALE